MSGSGSGSGRGTVPFDAVVRDLLHGGYTARFRATGDSMNPTIACGEYVRVEPCSGTEVRRGDVLLIDAARGLTAHRLVRIRRAGGGPISLITRGDNSLRNDSPVAPSSVLGRVTAVERGGALAPVAGEPVMKRYTRALVRRVAAALQRLTRR